MKTYIMMVAIVSMVAISIPASAQVTNLYANTEVKNSYGDPMLLGYCSRSLLQQGAYQYWFLPGYHAYQPDSLVVQAIHSLIKGKRIEIFLGTWCGDSRREVPRMLLLLDRAKMDTALVKLIFVSNEANMYKQSPGHEETGKNIKRVPTLIVYDDKEELGRIIECPVITLEKDLLAILKRENYVPYIIN